MDPESYGSQPAFLRMVRDRGVSGAGLVVSDTRKGFVTAMAEAFRGAARWHRAVHLMRDCLREAGSWRLRKRIGRILSPVFRGRDSATVAAMYHAVINMLKSCRPRAAAILEEAESGSLAHLAFPLPHWKRLRTNNVQKHANRKIERRPRLVQAFPSTGSLVRLAGAVMCEQDEIWQESRYFSKAMMSKLYDERLDRKAELIFKAHLIGIDELGSSRSMRTG